MKKTIRGKAAKLSRRTFIVGSAAAGGGLALGFNLPLGFAPAVAQSANEGAEVNAWVFVKPDDTCVIRVARSEMGQGTITGLVQLVAEELECDWNKVKAEQVTPGQNLARKRVWGEMSTGGSRGIRTSQDYVRRGGAAARMMLLQAAAEEWKVPVGELTAADGVVTHATSRRSLSYGKLAAAAAGRHLAPDAFAGEVLPGRDLFRLYFVPIAFELFGDELDEARDRALSHLRTRDTDHAGIVGFDENPGIDFGAFIGALRNGGTEARRQIESECESTTRGGGADDEHPARKLRGFAADRLFHGRPP